MNGTPEQWDSAALHFEAIDIDVNRTYVKCDEERETLRRVLWSFALHAPSVGYCQVSTELVRWIGNKEKSTQYKPLFKVVHTPLVVYCHLY